jgi:hypothetical protein
LVNLPQALAESRQLLAPGDVVLLPGGGQAVVETVVAALRSE